MNCRYFSCDDCQRYTDAGYRWAYWLLEHPGLVRLGEAVRVTDIFAASDYWNPPPEEQSDWLVREVLPSVRTFLTDHAQHSLRYVEEEYFYELTGYEEFPTKPSA